MSCKCGRCDECNWARFHPDEDPANKPIRLNDYDQFVDDFWFIGNSDLGGMDEQAYLGLCIAGEAGEVAEKLKKAYRDSGGKVNVDAMVKELGDVLYYLVRYAHLLGHDLEDVARKNVEKLQDRAARNALRGKGDDR
jgi:NTP pyrophosphatase (non-canonical NTP hydrolase)